MSRRPAPTMILDLPDLPARNALHAGLMAMRVPRGTLPADHRGREAVLRQLVDHPETVAFIDISRSERSMRPTLLQLDAQIPRGEWRRRVFLTRLADSHVSESDRRWAASLGFPHLFPGFDADECEGNLRTALDKTVAVGQALGKLGLLVHVAQEHPLLDDRLFIDGTFFYRFSGLPSTSGASP
jgi:hypothetical protein